MDSENDEEGVVPYKTKYRQLKSRLKYLIYEHECFENDIQKAQVKLMQLSRDKNFLLDQLMRYEAVVLSGGEETDYSSGEETPSHPPPPPPPPPPEKTESGVKSEAVDESVSLSSSSPARVATSTTKSAAATVGGGGGGVIGNNTPTVIHNTTSNSTANSATTTASTLTVKSGGVQKATNAASTKVSAMAAAKITKAVARARQGPQQCSPTVIVSTSPLIVSLPIGTASGGGWGKLLQQATPLATPLVKHTPQIMSLSSGTSAQSTTAAILASIPAPAKPPRPKPLLVPSTATRPSGKGTPPVGVVKGAGSHRQGASSSSSSTSSSDSEDSASESSTSGSSRDDEEEEEGSAMDTGGPVPIVHSVPVPAGAPQLLRPKAIVSPVKAPPPKLISMGEHPSGGVGGGPTSSPLSATPPGGVATRFLWSSRAVVPGSGREAMPSLGFVSIVPLASPTSLSKSSSGSAFQLVTSPPGSAPLARPPSLQDLSGAEPGKPHPPP